MVVLVISKCLVGGCKMLFGVAKLSPAKFFRRPEAENAALLLAFPSFALPTTVHLCLFVALNRTIRVIGRVIESKQTEELLRVGRLRGKMASKGMGCLGEAMAALRISASKVCCELERSDTLLFLPW